MRLKVGDDQYPKGTGRRWAPPVVSLAAGILGLFLGGSAPVAAADDSPRRGGILRVARPNDPQSINPAVCYDIESLLITRLIFQGLVDFDEQQKIVPKQATDWVISADRKTYTFHLRPGVRFANGREVVAADYVYSLQRVLDLKNQSPGEAFFNGIVGTQEFQQGKARSVSGLRAPEKYTLEIELGAPDFAFEFKLAMTFACVVPREALEAQGSQFWLHAFGTGPYQLKDWTRGVKMTLERSPQVNQSDEGYFDRIEVMIGGDRALHTMMLERGEMDFVYLVQVPDIVRLSRGQQSREGLQVISQAFTDFLYLNTEMPPFDQLKVRQAVAQAIDTKRLASLTAHTAEAPRGILPPLMLGFNPDPKGFAFNPERARQLLQEAGHKEPFSFDLWYSEDDPRTGRIVGAIESDLRAVGITANLRRVTMATLLTGMQTRKKVTGGCLGWGQDYPDPSNFLDVLFNGAHLVDYGGNNFAYYNNAEVNQRLGEAERVALPAERYRRYQEIEKLILQDAPMVPLGHSGIPVLVSPAVGGFRPHPVWSVQIEHWWLREPLKK